MPPYCSQLLEAIVIGRKLKFNIRFIKGFTKIQNKFFVYFPVESKSGLGMVISIPFV